MVRAPGALSAAGPLLLTVTVPRHSPCAPPPARLRLSRPPTDLACATPPPPCSPQCIDGKERYCEERLTFRFQRYFGLVPGQDFEVRALQCHHGSGHPRGTLPRVSPAGAACALPRISNPFVCALSQVLVARYPTEEEWKARKKAAAAAAANPGTAAPEPKTVGGALVNGGPVVIEGLVLVRCASC